MTTSVTPDTPATRPDRDDAYVTRLELVNRLALLAASSLDLPAVLKTITQELRAAFSSYSVSIAMIDGDMLAFQATDSIYGFWDAEHLKTRRHRRDGPSGMARALRKGSLLHIPDAAQDPQHTPSPVLPLARCELATPLIAGDEMVGGITALGDRPHFFSPADERLMTAVAPHAASAIRNALAHTAAQRSLAQLEAIQQTSAAIASELDQSPLLQQLVTRAMQLLGGSSGGIYLWDADAEVLRLESAASPLNVGAVLRPGEGASGVAFQTGQPLNIPDYRAWPGHSPVFESSQLRSVIAVPLNYRQETIGVLTVSHNAESNRYSDADMRLLALFANQAAVAITNARLFQETRGQTQEISRLYAQAQHILRQMRFFNGVTRGLSLEAPLDTVLQAVADRIQQAFNYPYVDIALINADDDSLSYRASSSSQPGYTLEIIRYRLPLDESRITTQAVLTRNTYYARDTHADPYYRPARGRTPTASELAVPIMHGGRVIGALNLERYERNGFSDSDIALAEALAFQLASIIQNAELIDKLSAEQRRLAAVQQTSAEVAGELDLQALLGQVIERSMRLLGGTGGGIYLWDKQAGVLRQAATSLPERLGAVLRPGEGASGAVFQSGEPLVVNDYKVWPGRSAIYDHDALRAIIAVPLTYRQETIGVLTLSHYEQTGAFKPADIKTLSLFANQAAIAITNARLFREARDQAERNRDLYADASRILSQLRFFNEVTQDLRVGGSLDEKLQAVADRIHQTFGYPFVDIALLEGETLVFRASVSDHQEYVDQTLGYRLPLSERRVTTHAVLKRSTHYAPDTSVDPYYRMPYGYFPTGSELAVPIMLGEQVIGTMNLEHRQRDAFSKSDIALVEALAVQLAAIIQNARLIEQLNAEQQQLASTLDQIADGLLTVNAGGEVVALNAKAAGLLATTAEAALGRPCDDLLAVRDGDQTLAAIIAQAAAERRTVSPGEHWLTLSHTPLPDQTLTISLAPLSNAPAGERPRMLVALWDVTARAQLDRLRSEIVSNVSHELRTPLTRMRLRAEQAQAMHDTAAPGQEAFAAMLADIHLLEQLIANILQAARIEGGRVALQRRPLALPPLARQIARESGQGERFTLELAADTPLADGDPHRVHEVLTNLVNNAIQYSPPGSPITIRTGAAAGGMALVSVCDHGEGVPEADRAMIFDRFYRVQRDSARAAYGSGLGLYIARGLVEAHGGRIWVESEERAGSTFHFTLPAYNTHSEDEHDSHSDH